MPETWNKKVEFLKIFTLGWDWKVGLSKKRRCSKWRWKQIFSNRLCCFDTCFCFFYCGQNTDVMLLLSIRKLNAWRWGVGGFIEPETSIYILFDQLHFPFKSVLQQNVWSTQVLASSLSIAPSPWARTTSGRRCCCCGVSGTRFWSRKWLRPAASTSGTISASTSFLGPVTGCSRTSLISWTPSYGPSLRRERDVKATGTKIHSAASSHTLYPFTCHTRTPGICLWYQANIVIMQSFFKSFTFQIFFKEVSSKGKNQSTLHWRGHWAVRVTHIHDVFCTWHPP